MNSMSRRRSAVTALMYSVLVLTAAVASAPAWGASTNPTVTIVNTTANPVPVSGSITVDNTVVPVEVSNADPIPVSNPPRTYGTWALNFDGSSDAIFTVPAGKRAFVTDMMAEAFPSSAPSSPPRVALYAACGQIQYGKFLAGWYLPPIAAGPIFQLNEHLTSGIPLAAGDCLRVVTIPSASVTLVWYMEDAP